jgi:hypothetical protein
MDVHREVADGAPGAQLDLGMPPPHAREAIYTVDDDCVSVASDAFNGNGVVAEARDETIPLFRLGGAAGDDCQRGEEEGKGLKQSSLQNHVGSFDPN